MPKEAAIEAFTKNLFLVLDETFLKHHGIYLDKGTSLFETLDRVSAEEASQAASEKSATIAAHVKHVCFYLEVLERFMMHHEVGTINWQDIWKNTKAVNAAEWDALRQILKETHHRLLATMTSFDAWDDENRIGGSLAIVAHTAYHLGGIRQALSVIRS